MNRALKGSLFAFALGAVSFPVLALEPAETLNAEANQNNQYGQSQSMGMDRAREYTPQADADNTQMNKRDRYDATMTPLDQGTSPEDIEITADIRKIVMAREGMSITAQNTKIITYNGMVTLRGPVKTNEEKSFIAETARARAGLDRVDDQLEVIAAS